MKLKSLKLALRLLDVCLKQHKSIVRSNEEYDKGIEAYEDIKDCIKVTEKQLSELKSADIMGNCLCFQILVDFPDRGYWKDDDPLNPYLRAEKIEKEMEENK